MSALSTWRRDKGLSQEAMGRKLGLGEKWKNYPNWESGRSPFPKEIREKLTKMGYGGAFSDEPSAAPAGLVSREELATLRGEIQTEFRLMRETMEKLAEAVRALIPQAP